eukprot:scaffold360_cov334-Prasinococcus_capsulatus_cf.AAC.4
MQDPSTEAQKPQPCPLQRASPSRGMSAALRRAKRHILKMEDEEEEIAVPPGCVNEDELCQARISYSIEKRRIREKVATTTT